MAGKALKTAGDIFEDVGRLLICVVKFIAEEVAVVLV